MFLNLLKIRVRRPVQIIRRLVRKFAHTTNRGFRRQSLIISRFLDPGFSVNNLTLNATTKLIRRSTDVKRTDPVTLNAHHRGRHHQARHLAGTSNISEKLSMISNITSNGNFNIMTGRITIMPKNTHKISMRGSELIKVIRLRVRRLNSSRLNCISTRLLLSIITEGRKRARMGGPLF